MASISCKDVSDKLRVITLIDRMDVQGTEKIEGKLGELAEGSRNIIVDLREVTFLSSVGIRALVANGKKVKTAGARMLIVVGENAAVMKTLKMTVTDALLPVFIKQEEAMASLAS
jgi:anti-anti-sigma factor